MENHPRQGSVRATAPGVWNPRYRMLDAWRGMACLMVVVYHAGQALAWSDAEGTGVGGWARRLVLVAVRGMNLGVPLFFVISGYCIAASAEGTRRKGGSAWAFMGRRAWRIYPPYWAAVLGFVAVVVALDGAGLGALARGPLGVDLDPPAALDWRQWLGNLTLTETWRPYVWGPPRDVYTSVAWTLCFEEQFYLVCFLALLLVPGRFLAALGGATLAIVAVRFGFWWAGGLGSLRGTFPLLWHEFAAGLAVYYRLNVARRWSHKRLVELGLGAMLLVGVSTHGGGTVAASAFGLVLIAFRPYDDRWSDFPSLAFFHDCGRRCYSIYLAHLPFVVVGNRWLFGLGLTGFWARAVLIVPLVSVIGVAAGWAFHALVEAHFLGLPPLPSRLGPPPRSRGQRPRIGFGAGARTGTTEAVS